MTTGQKTLTTGQKTLTTAQKTFSDLTERQQKAVYAFAKKYRQDAEDVAPRLDTFFKLAHGEITISQAEKITGLVIIDQAHPTLF